MQDAVNIMDLIKYDYTRGVFVLSSNKNQVEYWPDTNIVKSKNNAFDWQGQPSRLAVLLKPQQQQVNLPPHTTRNFTIYSKARRSK